MSVVLLLPSSSSHFICTCAGEIDSVVSSSGVHLTVLLQWLRVPIISLSCLLFKNLKFKLIHVCVCVQTQQITPQLALQVLLQFDKAINTALANRVRNRVNFRVSPTVFSQAPPPKKKIIQPRLSLSPPLRDLWTHTGSATTCGRSFWTTLSSERSPSSWRSTRSRLSPVMERASRPTTKLINGKLHTHTHTRAHVHQDRPSLFTFCCVSVLQLYFFNA